MKKVLLIMAAALMTMTQCRKQETVPATPSANTIKMTITAGPGAKTDITDEGVIKWTSDDVLYVSDGAKWLGSLTLQSGAGNARGTFTGNISEISNGTTCHFFYLGHDNGMTAPTANTTTDVSISFASQDGSKGDALKYHLGHGSADVTVSGGVATGAVAMRTEIAMAHIKLTMDSKPYTGSVTMDVSNTMTVSPAGSPFSGSGNGIAIGNNGGTSGDRYVTLIPTGTSSVDVSFSGSATGSMTFGQGIQANNLYGMANEIEVTLARVNVTDVTLNKTTLSLEVGGTETLTATVTPDNATDKSVTWSSNATGVATVSDNGVVTAVAAGTATITVTATNGTEATDDDKTATCDVEVTAAHEYVDLGLPSGLLWATCNLGADSPEKYGDYYQWGGVTSVTSTDINVGWAGCPFTNGTYSSSDNKKVFTKYVHTGKTEYWAGSGDPDNKLVLDLEDDAARVNWGSDWRMPTGDEWKELYDNTTSAWTDNYNGTGVKGLVFTSTTNGEALFLPAAGRRNGTDVGGAGKGYYWSSSLHSSYPYSAYHMYFYLGTYSVSVNPQLNLNRYYGCPVRPVRVAR